MAEPQTRTTGLRAGVTSWLDLGSGVFVKFHTCSHMGEEMSGALVRFGGELEDAGFDRDDICVGAIGWCRECAGESWELHSLDPLHVEPSVQTTCAKHPEHHGWIRGGRWVPA